MRILKRPKVYLLARPALVAEGLAQFLSDHNLCWPTPTEGVSDAARLIETAGRCCYMSFGKKAGSKTNFDYIQNLMGRRADGTFRSGPAHGSVVEHPVWSFIVTGAGRGFSHEQVRHRAGWAYSQLSTRYCDFERDEEADGTWDPGFTIPPLAQLSEEAQTAMAESLKRARDDYVKLLRLIENDLKNNRDLMERLEELPQRERERTLRKAARGAARDLLPTATEAIMVMSANARAIWNSIVMRGDAHAEAEIREIYVQIARIMEKELPALFYGIHYEKLWDGTEAVLMPREKL